jgi:hypothetical protein
VARHDDLFRARIKMNSQEAVTHPIDRDL